MRRAFLVLLSLAPVGAVAACGGDPDPERPGSSAGDMPIGRDTAATVGNPGPVPDTAALGDAAVVEVWFSRGEAPVSVARQVRASSPRAALKALVAGPTAEERAAGLSSWFSEATVGTLGEVEEHEGFLIVGFRGLDGLIPGAGSSAGSARLLASLDSTVFQFPGVDSVEYRLDGSCAAFWEWLQRGCEVVRRP